MSTQTLEITETWQDITANASLVADQSYVVQNNSVRDIYISEQSGGVPAATDKGIAVGQKTIIYILQQTNTFYARVTPVSSSGDSVSDLTISESLDLSTP